MMPVSELSSLAMDQSVQLVLVTSMNYAACNLSTYQQDHLFFSLLLWKS